MVRLIYDFREGLEQEKIIYKKKGSDWKSFFYYMGYLLSTWACTIGWFALFQYAYINHEYVAFYVYIAVWLLFVIFLLVIFGRRLLNFKKNKKLKKEKRHREEMKHGNNQPFTQLQEPNIIQIEIPQISQTS